MSRIEIVFPCAETVERKSNNSVVEKRKGEGYSPEEVNGRDDPCDNEADDQKREDYASPVVATLRVR